MSHDKQQTAAEPHGSQVESVIDMLLHMRQEFSRLSMYIGELNVFSLNGFILGFRICLSQKGNTDDRYFRFREWLREAKQEFPTEGWCAQFLRDADGDHLQAIRRFLDRVEEFHSQEEHSNP